MVIRSWKRWIKYGYKKIILSGDSTGGILASAFLCLLIVINLLENKNIKIPDLILLQYPNYTMELNKMNISMCSSVYESGMNPLMFGPIIKHYLGDFQDYKNIFVSPLYAPEKIVEQIPRIRLIFRNIHFSRDEFLKAIYNYRKCKDITAYNILNLNSAFNGSENADISEIAKDFVVEK